jgi:plastocyanin
MPEDKKPAIVEQTPVATEIVRIRGYEGVFPLNIFIKPGTVVIWLNQYKGKIRVTFPDKKVSLACQSPVNFSLSGEGHFVADAVAFGAIASLCFVEPGTYDYYIERSPLGPQPRSERFRFQGQIKVRQP